MSLDELQRQRVLGPLDVRFASALARIGDAHDPDVILAAALASRHARKGHVCVDLAALAGRPIEGVADEPPPCWPGRESWLEAVGASPLVSSPPARHVTTPLVMDVAHRLYLTRYWLHQEDLARRLLRLAAAEDQEVDGAVLEAGLARLFPGADDAGQRHAAAMAVQRRLAVISGGPGTGKTATVVRILALLAEQAASRGTRPPTIQLVAPTGKAAARLAESIRDALASSTRPLDCAPGILAAIPAEASTIHRALGWKPAGGFRHDDDHPLAADLVVVDEASMVDLVLMSRLVAALPRGARLILLGDKDQLASVQAGAVLGDICDSAASALANSVAQLTHSYRFGPDSGIGRLAQAIHRGDEHEALALLDQAPDLRRLHPTAANLARALEPHVLGGFGPYLDQVGPAARLVSLGRFRVLCAHRRGPFGVETVNPLVEGILSRRKRLDTYAEWYLGRPILVTTNDYDLQLFNGDVGLVDRDEEGALRAFFPAADSALRALTPARLPAHETVFATTVHKSQGSEFDHVAIVLPPTPSPAVTRELLYTAVTRARKSVVIVGTSDVIRHAVRTPVERASGLRDRLRVNGASSPG